MIVEPAMGSPVIFYQLNPVIHVGIDCMRFGEKLVLRHDAFLNQQFHDSMQQNGILAGNLLQIGQLRDQVHFLQGRESRCHFDQPFLYESSVIPDFPFSTLFMPIGAGDSTIFPYFSRYFPESDSYTKKGRRQRVYPAVKAENIGKRERRVESWVSMMMTFMKWNGRDSVSLAKAG
jgi:hypothetical protein